MTRIRNARVLSAALPITVLILAGTAYADPVLAESLGLDVWEVGRLENDLRAAEACGDRLEAEFQSLQELMAVNDVILADVAAGRLELSAAARRKWELNRHRPTIRDHLNRHCRGRTGEEKVAHDLCRRIGQEYRAAPDFDALVRRLHAEYETAYHAPLPGVNR
ncbi:hypothetical protein [Limnoglobus roseus]|uniref:Lysozyme inhibitor LprI N-terminal domain-containing protein n=1 Tax=Limnoglobus roseus TaxID=2598579 RepID=A0A5C1AF31_9BACT|nr:hypothetical protein [Limnoglobus roseus]QEL16332.1 hypothetical protein PX52LOC_03278 [Limnoglobus roseus]